MKNREQLNGRGGRTCSPVQVLILFLVLLAAPFASRAQSGNGMYDAIYIGNFYGHDYHWEYGNNYYYNGIYYQDNYSVYNYNNNAQPSPDVWYSFTVTSTLDLDVTLCGSILDAHAHLLDQYGNDLAHSGGGLGCGFVYPNLTPGIYYLVVEGNGYTTGDYDLVINFSPGSPPSPGANMSNAIDAGTLLPGGSPFSDTRSNVDPMLGNDMGHPSNDIYYKFTLTATAEVQLSHCGSGIDTYMHLLSSSGATLLANDDNYTTSPCPGTRSYIQTTLPAGTYYVVSEGYNTHAGWITTTIGIVPPPLQVPAISYPDLSGLVVGVPVNLLPTNSGGPVAAGQGVVGTFAGSGAIGAANGTGTAASFNQPAGGVFDAAGNLYIADIFNHRIRKITPAGVVSTFAGSGAVGSANGMGTAASFDKPYRLAMDAAGNLYVSGRGSNKIRKISPAGMVSTLAGSGVKGFADGPASTAAFNDPSGIAVDGSGNVYVSEQGNHRVRKITPSGVVSTLAGSGTTGSTNGTGGSARFNYPLGMAIDASGNLYVADYNNHKIRRVTLSGVVTTFAGSGSSGSADGASGSATFKTPLDVAVDASGNVHITDANHKIRKISGGQVSTFAGTGQAGSVNGPYLSASFRLPHGLSFDSQGNLYVADTENHKVRRLGSSPAYSISPALPAGLTFNTSTGGISGTPTAVSPATSYTVTASNAAGSSTVTIIISVAAAPAQPSSDKNYIRTTTYREPFTVVPAAPLISDAMVEVAYFDGLGRPLQQVSVKASPDGQKDIVTPIIYDAFGRQDKNYLPFATATGAGGEFKENAIPAQENFYNSPPVGVVQIPQAGGVTPSFAKTVFEASPLNRVLEQGAPGAAWQPAATRGTSGRTVLSEQATNNTLDFGQLTTTRKVALYGVSLSSAGVPTLTLNDAYDANQLYVSITKDENWLPADGRKGTVEEYTDKQGRVVLKRTFNEKDNLLEMLSTYYVYDDFGNLSFVLPPGVNPDRDTGAPTATELDNFAYRYRYDGRNRLVEKQLPGKGVEYIVYNKIDQVVATQDANQRQNNQWLVSKYDGLGRNILTGIWDSGNTAISRDALQTLVDAQNPANLKETRIFTGNGYTNLSWPTTNIVTMLTLQYYDNYNVLGLPAAYERTESQMTHGLPTVMRTKVLGQGTYMDNMLWEVSYYDDKGRVSRQIVQHFKGGGPASDDNFDEIENQYSFTGQLESSIRKHYAGSASIPAVTVTTEHTYDHMERPLDTWSTVDYGTPALLARKGYNEIGQLTTKQLHSTDDGSNFLNTESYYYNARGWLKGQSGPRFSMELDYELGPNPQYNGNISSQYWGTASNPTLHNYSYLYDKLNRLSSGISDEGFNETISYDKMGNIVSLNRNPMGTNTYSYNGNRLASISGFINSSYTYDGNGNQTADNHKGITLNYNYLNLPQTIGKASTSETMTNTWLATGAKIRKTVGGMTREYVSGIEYNDGQIEFIQTPEGRVIPSSSGYRYEYMLKDHLGNTRVLLDEYGTVLETSDYYPFGLQVARGQTVISPENRYKYNGKELQTELGLGQYDYGARFYDPVIGRWNVIDPLSDEYEEYSPYNYTLNNPVNAIDPDGQWVLPAIRMAQAVLRNPVVQRELAKLGAVTSAYIGGQGVITEIRNNNAKRDATNVVTNNSVNSQAVTPSKADIANMKARLEDPKGSESNPQGSSKAARKDVMRKEGIPTSQQPSGQQKSDAGNTLEYDVPKPGGGTEKKVVQDQKKDENHGPHWEAGKPKANGQEDPSGRPRLQNGKSKSHYE